MKKILVVAAHPDDEVLGCGGTIARHIDEGDEVHIVFMADGVTSRETAGEDNLRARNKAAYESCVVLGAQSPLFLGFPDNKMDTVALLDVVQFIENVIEKLQPKIIYTHHIGDLNIDHQITHKAVMTACRPQPDFCVKEIYAFEVLSSTEWQTPGIKSFCPNMFVDITDYIDLKKQALEAYSCEMHLPPHSRSVENSVRLSSLRGSAFGVEYAESFMTLRIIK